MWEWCKDYRSRSRVTLKPSQQGSSEFSWVDSTDVPPWGLTAMCPCSLTEKYGSPHCLTPYSRSLSPGPHAPVSLLLEYCSKFCSKLWPKFWSIWSRSCSRLWSRLWSKLKSVSDSEFSRNGDAGLSDLAWHPTSWLFALFFIPTDLLTDSIAANLTTATFVAALRLLPPPADVDISTCQTCNRETFIERDEKGWRLCY